MKLAPERSPRALPGPPGKEGTALAAAPDAVVCALSLALTTAAAAGWGRVFAGTHWAYPVLLTASLATVAAYTARRAGLGPLWSALAGLVATWVTAAETVLPGSMQAGLPLLKAVAQARSAVDLAGQRIPLVKPPVPALPGFVLGAAWGAGLCATVADYALAAKRSLAGLVPALVMFVSCSALGTASGRLWAVAALTAAMVALALAHQAAFGRQGRWVLPLKRPASPTTGDGGGAPTPEAPVRVQGRRAPGQTPNTFLPTLRGVSVAAAALGAAVAVVPALGPDGHGPAGWLRHIAQPVRLTPDPMVSMAGDLHEQYPLPAFLVRSGTGSYWRLTSVAHFSGTAWTSSGQYQPVDGALPGVRRQPGTLQVTETFAIQDLGSPWLPTGFRPERVDGATNVSWDPTSSSLLGAAPTSNGQQYTVQAEQDLATLSPATLNAVGPITAADRATLAADLQLPAGLPAKVGALARLIAGGARTEYDKALALQDYFHRPPFVYTLDPPVAKGRSALADFLFSSHAGFCQQYAGAFGVLARLVGLPTRIAVGFTTGARVGPGTWEVVATDAHAWPEVWFPHTGWVPFEPTPGFSIPQAAQYTGSSGLRTGPPGNSGTRSGAGNTPAGSTTVPGPRAGRAAKGAGRPNGRDRASKGRPNPVSTPGSQVPAILVALVAAGAAVAGLLGWAGLLALARSWRRRRRHARLARALRAPGRHAPAAPGAHPYGPGAPPAAAEILAIWEDLSEVLAAWGLARYGPETPAEWAARSDPRLSAGGGPGLAANLALLAAAVDAAAFGPGNDQGASPASVRSAAQVVRASARRAAGRRRRLAHMVLPSVRPHPGARLTDGTALGRGHRA